MIVFTGFHKFQRIVRLKPHWQIAQSISQCLNVFVSVGVRDRFLEAWAWVSSLRCVAGLEGISPDASCGNDMEDELVLEVEELFATPGTTVGKTSSVLQTIILPFGVSCDFWRQNHGEPVEFEWAIFRRIHNDWNSQSDPKRSERSTTKSRAIWRKNSVHVDVRRYWFDKEWRLLTLNSDFKEVRDNARRFQRGHWPFFGLVNEEQWDGTYSHKVKETWDKVFNQIFKHFAESGRPIFCGTSALNRGILTRKGGWNTTLNFLLRTIHSANQLDMCGAVSSWRDELAEQVLGQTHLGVDKSSSKVDDQWSKHLDPQEVGSLVQNQTRTEEAAVNCWRDHLQRFKMLDLDQQFRTIYESVGFTRAVSVGMHYRTSDDMERWIWKSHSVMQSTHYLVLILILRLSSGFKNIQRFDQFLRSRLSVILTNVESKFRSDLHMEIISMFGWSYASIQNAAWMSYDTRIQDILQKTLKKPSMETCTTLMQNNRLFNRDLNTVHLMTTCLVMKEHGKTSLHMSTDTSGKLVRHENRSDREVDGAIQWRMIRHKLKFTFMKQGGDTVIDRDSSNHIWKEAAKHDFSIARNFLQHYCTFEQFKDPLLGEIWSNQRWCVILLHFSSANNSYFTEDAHSIWSQSWRRDSLQGEQIAEKDDKLCFSISWIPGETRLKNNSKVTCWTPERAHSKTEWKWAQDAVYWIHLAKAQEKGMTFWQTQSRAIIVHTTVPPGCAERVISQKGETTLYQRPCTSRPRKFSKKCLESAAATRVTW